MENSVTLTHVGAISMSSDCKLIDISSSPEHEENISGISHPTDSLSHANATKSVAQRTTQSTCIQSTCTPQTKKDEVMIEHKENLIVKENLASTGYLYVAPSAQVPLQQVYHTKDEDYNENNPSLESVCPPLMNYTNSLAFSDVSMPFPSLATSKSFGPNGVLYCNNTNNNNNAGRTMPQLQSCPSMAEQSFQSEQPTPNETNWKNNMFHHLVSKVVRNAEQDDRKEPSSGHSTVSTNDLNIAARALLDLSPAVVHDSYRFGTAIPNSNNRKSGVLNQALVYDRNNHTTKTAPKKMPNHRLLNVSYDAKPPVERIPLRGLVESRANELLNNAPFTLAACKCKNSHCLKLYCSCFQMGTVCDELVCQCRKCENTSKHSKPRGSRTRAIYEVLNRRIDAFDQRERKKTGNGCSCKKSKCLQKYCDCFAIGELCSPGKCWCTGCENNSTNSHSFNDERNRIRYLNATGVDTETTTSDLELM